MVTGVGPVTPVGCGKEAYWESLICGKPAFKRVEFPGRDMDQYRCKVAAPIENFDLYQFVEKTKHSKYLGKTSRYAIAAAFLALKDAGLDLEKNEPRKEDRLEGGGQYRLKGLDSFRAGVILGFGTEAMELVEYYHEKFLATKGTRGDFSFRASQFLYEFVYLPRGPVFFAAGIQLCRFNCLCFRHPCHDKQFYSYPGGEGEYHGHRRSRRLPHAPRVRGI